MIKKLKMNILLWIQGWSGRLNSWAWTEWDKFHAEDKKKWVEGYKEWNEKKIKLFDDENNNDS